MLSPSALAFYRVICLTHLVLHFSHRAPCLFILLLLLLQFLNLLEFRHVTVLRLALVVLTQLYRLVAYQTGMTHVANVSVIEVG